MALDEKIALLRPELAAALRRHLARCASKGLAVAVTSTLRTPNEQLALWVKGRVADSNGIWHVADHALVVTNALPEQAPHCRGAAYDLCPLVNDKAAWDRLDLFQAVADCAQGLGLVWGGSWPKFKDLPHFELPNWRDLPLKGATP